MKRIVNKKIIALAVIQLLFTCAHQIPPSGGPDDKIPPKVSVSFPQSGAVRVPVTSDIVLTFSEWITPTNIDKCITIFPPPQTGFKVVANGKKLVISPKSRLADSTTYHVEVNNSLNDLHGNSIGTPYQLFFSTGSTIDSGRIFGCVSLVEGKPTQPKVALFLSAKVDSSDTVFFGQPSYMVQTDSSGTFSFDNIHTGTYELIAFTDDNNNARFDPGREQAYSPVARRIVLTHRAGPVVLYPVVCDTTSQSIIAAKVKPVSATCIAGEWVGGSMLPPFTYDKPWKIEGTDSAHARKILIKEYVPVVNTPCFYLRLGDTLGLLPYRLIAVSRSSMLYKKGVVKNDTIRFNGISFTDTTMPMVKDFTPKTISDLKSPIKLVWSKPVFCKFSKWYCVDSLKDSIAITVSANLSDTTTLIPAKTLLPDSRYTIRFPDSLFFDICGNKPKDTTGIVVNLSTAADQELCYSLSGSASCLQPDLFRKWVFTSIGTNRKYTVADNKGQFRFDSIAAGKGMILMFTDANKDGAISQGSLVPWIAPEPYRNFPDTVEARKNWDIDGVTVTGACEVCFRKVVQVADTGKAIDKNKK